MDEKYYKKELETKDEIIKNYKQQIELLKERIAKLECEVYKDSLTDLFNRKIIERVDCFDSIILCDIDHFKKINDMYGHDIGDTVLVEVSNLLKENVDSFDIACRWGGEEFLLFLKKDNLDEANVKAESIRRKLKELKEKLGFNVTMSFGVTTLKGKKICNAIKEADIALYTSKHSGRNKVTVYNLKY